MGATALIHGRKLLPALMLAAACTSTTRPVATRLPEMIFDLPALEPCATPTSLTEVAATMQALQPIIGRYPPVFTDAAHRAAVFAEWTDLRACAEALPADREPERRLYVLAEIYRQGHNMDVSEAASQCELNLQRCLDAFPESTLCNASASYFYLSIYPSPENLDRAEKSLSILRERAVPGYSEEAEAGFVFLEIFRLKPANARSQIDHYLELFPTTQRAAEFRKMRSGLGDQLELEER